MANSNITKQETQSINVIYENIMFFIYLIKQKRDGAGGAAKRNVGEDGCREPPHLLRMNSRALSDNDIATTSTWRCSSYPDADGAA